MQKKEEMHKAEVTRLKEEHERAATSFDVQKKDLELVLGEKIIAEKQRDDIKSAMSKRAQDDTKIKQKCKDHEENANKAEAELAAHKKESAQWLSELNKLNRTMDRKLAEFIPSLSSFSRFGLK